MAHKSLGRFSKDQFAGALMLIVGVGAIYFAWPLNMGTAASMGPGYFPTVVGAVIALLGVAIAATPSKDDSNSLVMDVVGEPPIVRAASHAAAHQGGGKPEWRGWCCIIGGFISFIVLFENAGMVPAVTGMTFIAGSAERGNSFKTLLWLAIFLNFIMIVVFWWALKMNFSLFLFSWS